MSVQRRIYHSGCDRAKFVKLIASEGGCVMISPPQKALTKGMLQAIRDTGTKAVIDSGGFQGQTDPQKYADILLQVHEYFDWFPNLDKIGDQQGSNQNFEALRQILPADLHSKLIWVYQGGDLGMLREFCQEFRFIGIGGLVPISRDFGLLKRHLDTVGSILQEYGTTAHVFGITGVTILKWLTFQSWFQSTDSTRWLSGIRHDELFSTGGKSYNCDRDGFMFTPEERARHSIRVLNHIVATDHKSFQFNLLGETA